MMSHPVLFLFRTSAKQARYVSPKATPLGLQVVSELLPLRPLSNEQKIEQKATEQTSGLRPLSSRPLSIEQTTKHWANEHATLN